MSTRTTQLPRITIQSHPYRPLTLSPQRQRVDGREVLQRLIAQKPAEGIQIKITSSRYISRCPAANASTDSLSLSLLIAKIAELFRTNLNCAVDYSSEFVWFLNTAIFGGNAYVSNN